MHLTSSEYRALKKAAKAFARLATADTTYYYVTELGGGHSVDRRVVGEVVFKRRLGGLVWGSHDAESAYIHLGGLSPDRRDPRFRGLHTHGEIEQLNDQAERDLLGSKHWRKELDNAASATRFTVR